MVEGSTVVVVWCVRRMENVGHSVGAEDFMSACVWSWWNFSLIFPNLLVRIGWVVVVSCGYGNRHCSIWVMAILLKFKNGNEVGMVIWQGLGWGIYEFYGVKGCLIGEGYLMVTVNNHCFTCKACAASYVYCYLYILDIGKYFCW